MLCEYGILLAGAITLLSISLINGLKCPMEKQPFESLISSHSSGVHMFQHYKSSILVQTLKFRYWRQRRHADQSLSGQKLAIFGTITVLSFASCLSLPPVSEK